MLLVDVREIHEREAGYIPESIHIPLNSVSSAFRLSDSDFLLQFKTKKPEFNDRIVTYCQRGIRSNDAQLQLNQIGYVNVGNYMNGWAEWSGHKRQ